MEYVIEKADMAKDGHKMVGFWKSNFPEWPEEKFRWFYRGNPSGEASFWLVGTGEHNDTVGTVALFPRVMYVNNVKKYPCIIGDLIFTKAHRNFWPALALQREVQSDVRRRPVDFVYGSPNKQADQLLRRSGYEIIGMSVTYKKPFKTFSYLDSRLKNRFLSRILAAVMDSILLVISRETWSARPANRKLSTCICDGFDKRFDQLWEKGRANYSIIGERSSQFLNWRFAECPYIDYRIFALTSCEGDQIHGYIVYKMHEHELIVADMFLEDLSHYADHLLSAFLRHARESGVDSVLFSILGQEELQKKLRRFGFFKTSDRRSFVVYASSGSAEKDLLFDSSKWYFVECDNDI